MRLPVLRSGFAAAFVAGMLVTRIVPSAEAQPSLPQLAPRIINLLAMSEDYIGPLAPNGDLRSMTLVTTPEGTVAVQSGNVAKHFYADGNEIPLVLDGAGSFWLGDVEQQVKPVV